MSLAPALKFITLVETLDSDYPQVLSMSQILRVFGIFAVLAAALVIYSLSTAFDMMN